MSAEWIWLSKEEYPEAQKADFGVSGSESPYAVAAFEKTVCFEDTPEKVRLSVSGDTLFRLFADGKFVGIGPASAGGDFLTEKPLPWQFINTYEVFPQGKNLTLFAEVQLGRQVLTEFTSTEGGFYLEGRAFYKDGREEAFGTDESWLCRKANEYPKASSFDNGKEKAPWRPAQKRPMRPRLEEAEIPMLDFVPIAFEGGAFFARTGEERLVELDKIYAATPEVTADGPAEIEITFFELPEQSGGTGKERIVFQKAGAYRSFRLYSVGGYRLKVLSAGEKTKITVTLWDTHYPVRETGSFRSSDREFDKVYDVARHTLMICRQTMHLDSPLHQELLACTGDYYIEMLMEAFTFGDLRLARLDLLRTAWWLEENDGRMFHTTYSLIWVVMLWKYYMLSGDLETVRACHAALVKLLDRFEGYLGENGMVETAPDYMFVDWVVTEGYTMHHPPKCLGQTVLNAFYGGALSHAARLAKAASFPEENTWKKAAEAFRPAFNYAFWDGEKRMYLDGLTTEGIVGQWQPENAAMKHYSRYTAALAVLYDLAPEGETENLLRLAAAEDSPLDPVQPYFMHFVLEAVAKCGAREKYAMPILSKWKKMVKTCSKGLQEGWIAPEPTYSFDHSHAWGGTPAAFLPQMLLGFEVLEPGMKKIRLSPSLLGLRRAEIEVPTPCGMLKVRMEEGKAAEVDCPEGLTVE